MNSSSRGSGLRNAHHDRRVRHVPVEDALERVPAWRHAEIVVMTWEMVAGDDAVAGGGRDVLVLDPDGRIRPDRMYVD
jgi:hypothetical protein